MLLIILCNYLSFNVLPVTPGCGARTSDYLSHTKQSEHLSSTTASKEVSTFSRLLRS